MSLMPRELVGSPTRRVFGNIRLLRAVWEIAAPYKWDIILLAFLITAGVLLPLIPPMLYRSVIDDLIAGSSFSSLLPAIAVAALLTILGVLFTYAYTVKASSLGRKIVADLQNRMFARLARKPIEFFTTVKAGAIGARLTSDVYAAEPLFSRVFVGLIANVMTLLGAMIILVAVDVRLAVILCFAPLMFLPLNAAEAKIRLLIRQQNSLTTELTTKSEALMTTPGMLLARQAGQLQQESKGFHDTVESLRSHASDLAKYSARAGNMPNLMFGIVTSLVFLAGAWLASEGNVSVGTLVLFLLYVRQVQIPLRALQSMRYEALTAAQAFDRVYDVLSTNDADDAVILESDRLSESPKTNDPVSRTANRGQADNSNLLAFQDVDFKYRSIGELSVFSLSNPAPSQGGTYDDTRIAPKEMPWVLTDVSFTLTQGEVLAIVGSSGSGKSTIAMLAAGLYRPTEGTILLDGRPTDELSLEELASKVALITQDTYVLHDTIRNNMRYVKPDASDAEIESVCTAARLDTFIRALPEGFNTVLGERGYRVSGGERQRLSLARALLKDAELIVMDEPTSQVDPETEVFINEATRALFRDKAVLIITHRLSMISHADRILVLEGGRIIEEGTHDDLLSKPGGRYAALSVSSLA